jgi:hypothetical protein
MRHRTRFRCAASTAGAAAADGDACAAARGRDVKPRNDQGRTETGAARTIKLLSPFLSGSSRRTTGACCRLHRAPACRIDYCMKALFNVSCTPIPIRTWKPMNPPAACVFDFNHTVPFGA